MDWGKIFFSGMYPPKRFLKTILTFQFRMPLARMNYILLFRKNLVFLHFKNRLRLNPEEDGQWRYNGMTK